MGDISELSLQVNKLKSCVETLTGIAEVLEKMLSAQEVNGAQGNAGTQAQPREKRATIRLDVDEHMSFEEMRHRMALIINGWQPEDIKALLGKYGANKLSEVKPEMYEALLTDAQAINNGR